ncbi:MAG: hypothetical protein PHR44_06805 [Candidatus Omnitrophica bacterium]|nr:hypothetical protein [Candidatus Omnitrophota bacterium]
MCGIFGITIRDKKSSTHDTLEHDIKLLFRLSEVRGQDSAGMAVLSHDEIRIFRRVVKPSVFLKMPEFRNTLKSAYFDHNNPAGMRLSLAVIGQCRLVTNGSHAIYDNNQPVRSGSFVGVHNGLISNAENLVKDEYNLKNSSKGRLSISAEGGLVQSDTRLFLSRLDAVYQQTGNFVSSVSQVFGEIEGSASLALMCNSERNLVIATNTGSLYYLEDIESGNVVFASENRILMDFMKKSDIFDSSLSSNILQIKAGYGAQIEDGTIKKFRLNEQINAPGNQPEARGSIFYIRETRPDTAGLRRCTKCVLPSTYPFISFDEDGVCNFCRRYERQRFKGSEELERVLEKYRSKDGSPDCLVGLSGGRDSCYGLHILKTKYGMNPIAYTYDWGLTTDASRRNQARICGKLGIEHIIRSPDLQKKRRHIRKNIYAWLKDPQLGIVPLFMAGDKDFYHFGRQLRREINAGLTVFCSGYLLEQREFFVGFCGVDANANTSRTARTYHYSTTVKLRLALYYMLQYLKNPRYINESFLDSVRSYFTTFIQKDDFLYLYEYLPWNERQMEDVLRREYNWQVYEAYGPNQWRMGDGQTAFTNYIYYTVAGFSEFDNFRSNQIREGLLTRDEALRLVGIDNQPRYEVLEYFSYLIGFNLDEVLAQIDLIPKLY